MLMNSMPRACFSSLSCATQWHAFLSHISVALFFFRSDIGSLTSDRKVMFHRAIDKPLVRFPQCATVQTHLHLALLSFAQKSHRIHFLLERTDVRRCCVLHIVLNVKISAQVNHSDVSGESGYNARRARITSSSTRLKSG